MEYMNIKKRRRLPTFISAGRVMMKVVEIILILAAFFQILKIFRILSNLMIVVAPPILKEVKAVIITLNIESKTTTKSKTFQLLSKYNLPRPIYFITASQAKTTIKQYLMTSATKPTFSGYPYH